MTSTSAFTCPKCSYRFRVKEKYLGQIAECPAAGCTQKLRLNPPPVIDEDSRQVEQPVEEVRATEVAADASATEPVKTENPAESSSTSNAQEATENPTVLDLAAAEQGSVISVMAMSPAESRRTQRALRRRATTLAPKVEMEKKPIDPVWIGFGSVIALAIIGGVAWALLSESEEIETKAPAKFDSAPIRVEGVEDEVSIARPQPILVSLRRSQQEHSADSLKKKYNRI